MRLHHIIVLLLLFAFSCKSPVHPTDSIPVPTKKVDELEQQLNSNKSRDVWQQPTLVLDMLGDLEGKTVADIGAGTGFFAFRTLLRNANVIAIDIDPKMLTIIESFKLNLNKTMQKKIQTRLALPNDPKIEKGEADVILIINTIGYIENRISYLEKLRSTLPEGGRLMIVDFKSKSLPIEAPDQSNRVPLFKLEKDLKDAGFSSVTSDDSTLDYQYIILAEK